jgi:cellulose synthase/poly-beta-1,6-N-acetylglucosamine synthase-like glycosyltransferase
VLHLISSIFCGLAILLALPVVTFSFEVIAAVLLAPGMDAVRSRKGKRESLAVLVPAHNESTGILDTLCDIKSQLRPSDRLLLIADNCDDDTAAVAKMAGAEVIERNDPTKIGKGYAVEFGLIHLRKQPPSVVIVIDADCRVAEGSLDLLADVCERTHRPVQALDLMVAGAQASVSHAVAEFAWRVKNWVRPLGLSALNLPCQLMGTGMAFPWETITSVDLFGSSVVEDLSLGLELARLRKPPSFCPSARVTSHFPTSGEAVSSQRKRWEGGHIATILRSAPRLIYQGLVERNWPLIILALDLAVPPLSLLALALAVMLLLSFVAAILVSSAALAIVLASFFIFSLGVILAWASYGRDVLPPKAFALIIGYVFAKLPLYLRIFSGRNRMEWKRTGRSKG